MAQSQSLLQTSIGNSLDQKSATIATPTLTVAAKTAVPTATSPTVATSSGTPVKMVAPDSPSAYYSGINGAAQANAAFIATLPVAVQQAVVQLTESGSKWLNTDANGTTVVTYSFLTKAPTEYKASLMTGFSAFATAEKTAARAALTAWSQVANIRFKEVSAQTGQVRFGNATYVADPAWAYYPGGGTGGDVWINPNFASNADMSAGSFGDYTMLHEVGHALGLAHAGYYNGDSSTTGRTI